MAGAFLAAGFLTTAFFAAGFAGLIVVGNVSFPVAVLAGKRSTVLQHQICRIRCEARIGRYAFLGEQIEAYEIVGSYCPGSYDLSVNGKKFAGISQRRLRQGVAVQVYLCIEGSGAERAEMIREVYEMGLQGQQTKFSYPEIKPDVMASLSEILDMQLTVNEVVIRLQLLLRSLTEDVRHGGLTDEEMDLYGFYLQRVFDRNQKMLS